MALEATVGVAVSLPAWTEAGFTMEDDLGWTPVVEDTIPPGLVWWETTRTLEGTPTEAGEYAVTVNSLDAHNNELPGTAVVTIAPGDGGGGDDGPSSARAVITEGMEVELDLRDVLGLELPDLTGATAAPLPSGLTHDGSGALSGTPDAPGEVTLELSDDGGTVLGTVVILVLPEGSQVTADPWDLWDNLAAALAPRVAAIVGRQGDEDAEALATAQLPLVAEYVRGYTRGRGFEGDAPDGPLRAVIVSATARLATNPEQVSVYTTGDYSERPAQLAGWTLAEIGVLHRYRVVTA